VSALAQRVRLYRALFYWQPTLYTKLRLSAWEMQERNRYGEAEFFQRAYRALAQRMQTLKPTQCL
jgi:hypothetical protein